MIFPFNKTERKFYFGIDSDFSYLIFQLESIALDGSVLIEHARSEFTGDWIFAVVSIKAHRKIHKATAWAWIVAFQLRGKFVHCQQMTLPSAECYWIYIFGRIEMFKIHLPDWSNLKFSKLRFSEWGSGKNMLMEIRCCF